MNMPKSRDRQAKIHSRYLQSVFATYICTRACLKNHSRNLHAPLCGIFHPNSVAVARYGALIRAKYPTNCDAHLAESLFQTRSNDHSIFNYSGKTRKFQWILLLMFDLFFFFRYTKMCLKNAFCKMCFTVFVKFTQ